jgi:recombination protein RecT
MDQTQAPARRELQVSDLLERNKDKISQVIAKSLDPQRFMRLCVGALRQTPKLRECSVESLVNSMIASGILGIEPNTPTGEGFILPYKGEAKFQLGYQGLLTLAARNGILVLSVDCIRENDRYEQHRGTRNELVHEIRIGDRGKEIAYYCVYQFPNGPRSFCVMDMDELNKVQASSRGQSDPDSPWQKWPEEQRKKTVVKRTLKMIPGKSEQLSLGLKVDGEYEAGLKPNLGVTLDITPADKAVQEPELPQLPHLPPLAKPDATKGDSDLV